MPAHSHADVRLDRDALLGAFHSYGKPREAWRVGAEIERHLLLPDGRPLPYFGAPGVGWLLDRVADQGAWERYFEGDHLIALFRGGASVTLEPGSQFELSGAPHARLAPLVAEAAAFADDVDALLAGTGVRQVLLGFTPYARIPEIPWVPKGRYVVMREHLGATGPLAHHMMKGTCATQATFDFADEADCAAKVQVGTSIGPLTTAIFANSPLAEGAPTGFMSFRGHIWTRTDPARTGFPEAAEQFSFERWTDYLLDTPMMFTKIDGVWAPARGLTFRRWMESGLEGRFPTWDDWDLHLTSVFPELRVKRGIEVRGADAVPIPLLGAFSALFEGIFYDRRALDEAGALGAELRAAGTVAERFEAACRGGLEGQLGGRRTAEWARELVRIAAGGLERSFPEDRPLLGPVEALAEAGRSPGAWLLDAWERAPVAETVFAHGAPRASFG